MRRSAFNIVLGLVLAIAGAAAVLSGAEYTRGAASSDILGNLIPVATVAIPVALLVIWLAEIRRVRGLVFWLAAGALIAGVGYALGAVARVDRYHALLWVIASGLAGGLIYWRVAGKNSGAFSAAIDRDNQTVMTSETAVHRRCWACVAAMLLVGAVPLALIGWHAAPPSSATWPDALRVQAEQQAKRSLAAAGLPWATLEIENHVGRLTGTAPASVTPSDVLAQANTALADLVGLPGVVAYLQNDIKVADVVVEPQPISVPSANVEPADPVASAKQEDRARRIRLGRGMTAAKLRRAQKLEAQLREAAQQAAERKRADERAAAAAASAAAEAARIRAAEDEKRKAEEAAAAAARAQEEQRRAEDAKRNEDEQRRLALEAEREKQAVAAARKAEAEKSESSDSAAASSNAQPSQAQTPSPINCDAEFAELFKAQPVQFARNASALDADLETFFDNAAALAGQCADYTIDIAGHADRTGSDAVNLATSLARAVSVRDALHARGVPMSRLKAIGYGDSRPLDPSRNRAAFARNRRVELSAARTSTPPSTSDHAKQLRVVTAAKPLKDDACHVRLNRAVAATPIRFAVNSTQVRSAAVRALGRLAHVMRRCPNHALAINGHTDRRGTIEYNRVLSERRAHAVRDLLIQRGISGEQLTAIGHGALMPLVEPNTRAAYARNRRVDFDVSAKAQTPK